MCRRCSVVFDKEAAKNVEGFRPRPKRKGSSENFHSTFQRHTPPIRHQKKDQVKTFTPPSNSPTEKWVFSDGKKSNYISPPAKWVKRTTSTNNQNEAGDSKKIAYNNNYKGKYPMTKTQWRRFQRQKKDDALKDFTNKRQPLK